MSERLKKTRMAFLNELRQVSEVDALEAIEKMLAGLTAAAVARNDEGLKARTEAARKAWNDSEIHTMSDAESFGFVPCPPCARGNCSECRGTFTSKHDRRPISCLCPRCNDYAKRTLASRGIQLCVWAAGCNDRAEAPSPFCANHNHEIREAAPGGAT